ncbi:ComEA family DNA-binding protein [Pseudotamlana carrageenivorans]|uniref:Competence protein ComEA n=1 Tax=Pseudotamlana carrageenivorans TaxID=2069432 RepID=A0A2I7SJ23_9FLAO|nr:helix-hairpin-helix domain-containing protein [Tamlana carrageenivorans]AUS05889.1 competence protein ComEA [Tamlana carrageenivorans]
MKSHVTFSRNQRHGIFLLLLLIIVLQGVYFFIDFPSEDVVVDHTRLLQFEKTMDSLRLEKLQKLKPKIKPFNPNYMDDFKGAVLGMSTIEIDRLLDFRSQNQWINSSEEFQNVTQISDSLFEAISPYFKFPDWVKASRAKKEISNNFKGLKTDAEKNDLNTATAIELQHVSGVGKVLSSRIVKYRNSLLGGFTDVVQLEDVYGLNLQVIQNITEQFVVKTPKVIHKIELNTATVNQLVTIPHIDYDLAHRIIEYRQLRSGYNGINELLKVKEFPVNKIKIIQLYLHLEKNIDE